MSSAQLQFNSNVPFGENVGNRPTVLLLNEQLLRQKAFVENMPFYRGGVCLREIQEDDFDGFHEIASHPGFVYYCFDGSAQKTRNFISEAVGAQRVGANALRKSFMLAVEDVTSRKIVGHVTADVLDKYPDYYDLAYFTHPQFQGRGIAKTASVALLDGMFSFLALEQFVATAHPANLPSRRILSWLGFEETAEKAKVESSDGNNERMVYRLKRSSFISKHGALLHSVDALTQG